MERSLFLLLVCLFTFVSLGTSFSLVVVKPSASAWFTSFHHEQQQQQSQNRRIPSMLLQMAKEEEESASMEESSLKNEKENTTEPTMDRPEVMVPSAGSQAELLYALGVNLARQLGDVRPLVESGDELAQVAKGMLDAVIGKLTEDGQRDLLTRRGAELNELITERA
jgi:hypothetical protein